MNDDYPDEPNPEKGFYNKGHKWMCFGCKDKECTLSTFYAPKCCPAELDKDDRLSEKPKVEWVIPKYVYNEVAGGVVDNPDYEKYYGKKPPEWRKDDDGTKSD